MEGSRFLVKTEMNGINDLIISGTTSYREPVDNSHIVTYLEENLETLDGEYNGEDEVDAALKVFNRKIRECAAVGGNHEPSILIFDHLNKKVDEDGSVFYRLMWLGDNAALDEDLPQPMGVVYVIE